MIGAQACSGATMAPWNTPSATQELTLSLALAARPTSRHARHRLQRPTQQLSDTSLPMHQPPARPAQGNHEMASRPEIKTVTKKPKSDIAAPEVPNQRTQNEAGPFRLQVDRQTKASYLTQEAAEAAGMVIKKGHPVVQVSVYNSAAGVNKIIELPTA
jgi:hypothetical protein